MRRFFCTAVNEETGEPVFMGELEAADFDQAFAEAKRLALEEAKGEPVRMTSVTEQLDLRESFTLRFIRETAAGLRSRPAEAAGRLRGLGMHGGPC